MGQHGQRPEEGRFGVHRFPVTPPRGSVATMASSGQVGRRQGDDALDRVHEICHDLRHPAATIRAVAAALEAECELPPPARDRLAQIVAEAKLIEQLCRQVTADGAVGGSGPTRLDHLAVEVGRSMRVTHPCVEVRAEPVLSDVDALSARRILWNLVDNACRAAGPEGRVVVAVWGDGAGGHLEVGDTGPGFGGGPPGSAALGLTIVRALVDRHGGHVEVGESELGGARVSVVLPLRSEPVIVLEPSNGQEPG